jgi:2'-5' RNA ligase
MDGIISLLDDTHYRLVEDLWRKLETQFGVHGVYATPYPHFSYHIADHYEPALLEPAIRRIAQGAAPFTVRAGGLGVFSGARPTLYVPIVRDAALTAFHRRVWEAMGPAAVKSVDYYSPPHWLPHITLGFADLTPDTLAQIIRLLAPRTFDWEITVTDLALIYEVKGRQELQRFPFGRWG